MTYHRQPLLVTTLLCFLISTSFSQIAQAAESPKPKTVTFNSRYYTITTDVGKDLAKEIASHMDAVFAEYNKRFTKFRSRGPVQRQNLHVYRSNQTYLLFLASNGINGQGSGGMFFQTPNASALCTFLEGQSRQRMFHTLRHEGFHQFTIAKIGDGMPPWINEGLAEYFGQAIMVNGQLTTAQVPPDILKRVGEHARANQHIPFNILLNLNHYQWNAMVQIGDASLQYQQSWAIVHFLINSSTKLRSAFENYLLAVSSGMGSEHAFIKAFGSTDYRPFEKAWVTYIKDLQPNPEKEAEQRLQFLGSGLRALTQRNIHVTSIDQLKSELQNINYNITQNLGHGLTLKLNAKNNALFTAPAPLNPRAKSQLTLITPKDKTLPPNLLVTGLKLKVQLRWEANPDNPKHPTPAITFSKR